MLHYASGGASGCAPVYLGKLVGQRSLRRHAGQQRQVARPGIWKRHARIAIARRCASPSCEIWALIHGANGRHGRHKIQKTFGSC